MSGRVRRDRQNISKQDTAFVNRSWREGEKSDGAVTDLAMPISAAEVVVDETQFGEAEKHTGSDPQC